MASYIIPIAVFAAILLLGAPFIGQFLGTSALNGITALSIAFSIAVVAALKWGNVSFLKGLPLTKQHAMIVAIVGFVYVFWSIGWFGLPTTASVTPIQATPAQAVSVSVDSGCSVPEAILGKSAAVTFNAYDMESNTPRSAAVDTHCWLYRDGQFITTLSDTSANRATGFSVGDVLNVYCGNTSGAGLGYYGDPVKSFCVDKEDSSLVLSVHGYQTEANMLVTCYDNTGATVLSAGTTNQEDYALDLSADQEYVVYCKLQNNGANAAYSVGGVATLAINDLDDFTVEEAGWQASIVPKWLASTVVDTNSTSTGLENVTGGYDRLYLKTNPVMLHEFDEIKIKMSIDVSSTAPAAVDTVGSTNTADLAFLLFVDATWFQGTDGNMYFDVSTHDDGESNVGIDETEYSPYGKQVGAIIEAY